MSLYELGKEYLRQAGVVCERIRELRADMRGLTKKQKYIQNCRIISLREVATELRLTGEYLTTYYGGAHE